MSDQHRPPDGATPEAVLTALLAGIARANPDRYHAIDAMLRQGRSAGDVSREMGISLSTVLAWRRAAVREVRAAAESGLVAWRDIAGG